MRKQTTTETTLEALYDKRRNLRLKQLRCKSQLGINRYGQMLHALDRQIAPLEAKVDG